MKQCENCKFFIYDNDCQIVENTPLPIVAGGLCTQWQVKEYKKKVYEDDPDEDEIKARIQKELKTWRSYELRHFQKDHKQFKPNIIPPYVHYAMIDALDGCESHDDISKVFSSIWHNRNIKSIATYQRALRELGTGMWRGEITRGDFTTRSRQEVSRSLEEAFFAGVESGGLSKADLTASERGKLVSLIKQEQIFITNLSAFIADNTKSKGGRLNVVRSHVDRWISRYANVKDIGFLIASRGKKKRWRVDPRKESCFDCLHLDGRIYTATVWLKNKIAPKSRLLACFGLWCGCTFEDTDEPVNRGRPPKLIGPKKAFSESDVNRDEEGRFAEEGGDGSSEESKKPKDPIAIIEDKQTALDIVNNPSNYNADGVLDPGHQFEVDDFNTFTSDSTKLEIQNAIAETSENVISEDRPKEIKPTVQDVLGKEYTSEQLASLTGMDSLPEGIEKQGVIVEVQDDGSVHVATTGGRNAVVSAEYVLSKDKDGKLVSKTQGFFLRPEHQGKGIGTSVLSGQVTNLRAAGFDRMELRAMRGKNMNGYYTWARLGYDADLPVRFIPDRPPNLQSATRISDLMRTQEGRNWWKENGATTNMSFDLDENSQSSRVLDAYTEARSER